jgi:alpha-glucosidase
MSTRPWWRDAVVYQIYVRSFADANGDGKGDLDGIRARLDHLEQLGVDAIWLTPFYPSPQMDHGYDVADYFAVEPTYGDLAALDALVAACRERGIRVLMDVVPNHCSSAHEWFRAALSSPAGSPERARFFFRDGRGGGDLPPNNWTAEFGGSAWSRVADADGSPGQWYLHTFTPWQPDFDWTNPDVADHFARVLRFWFDRGIDGFRVDAIQFVAKTPGLPDAPEGRDGAAQNPHLSFVDAGHDVWRSWRRTVDEYEREHPDRQVFLVGEAYTPRRVDLLASYVVGDELHQAFSFDLLLSPWHGPTLRTAIEDSRRAVEDVGSSPTWTLNNHDVQRAVTRYGRVDAHDPSTWTGSPLRYSGAGVDLTRGLRRARAAAVLVAALPGSLYLYQGEELGLPEVLDLPADARTDPIFTRTGGREIGRDGCRVPMPWDGEASTAFGFSTPAPGSSAVMAPWLPQPADWGRWSVAAQQDDPESMLSLYRTIVRVRRDSALHALPLQWIDVGEPDMVAFRRGDVTVVLNPTGSDVTLGLDVVAGARVLLSSLITPADAHVDPLADAHVIGADTCLWLRR